MSPEQARGSLEADARSDLYSIGVIIYEALTGDVPFDGKTINELMFAIALNDPKPLDEVLPGLDPGFKAIVDKAMAKDKEHRYQTADQFHDAIVAWQGKAPVAASTNPPAARSDAPAAMPAIGTGTTSPWSKSQADATLGKSKTPILAATIIGSAVMLSAVGFGAYSLLGGSDDTDDASAAAPSASAPELATEAESTPEPPKEPEPEPEVMPAPPPSASAEPNTAPEPEVKQAAPTPAAAPTPKPTTAPAPKPVPRVHRPAPKPAPKKASAATRFGY
jgi:serine/threonine-protein kinase